MSQSLIIDAIEKGTIPQMQTYFIIEAEAAFLSKFRPHIPSQFALRIILQELPLDNPKYLDRITGGIYQSWPVLVDDY